MNTIPVGILTNLLSEFVIVVLGVLVANFVKNRIDDYRYGQWKVIVKDLNGENHERPISPKKTKQILDVPEEKSVYLKGIAGTWGRINCDLIVDGPVLGMLVEDRGNRRFLIDMAKNPKISPQMATGMDVL